MEKANQAKVFQPYKQPAVNKVDGSTKLNGEPEKKVSAVSSLKLSPVDVDIPSDFDSSSSQESAQESAIPNVSLLKSQNGLRVPDDIYQVIDKCCTKIYSVAQRRESITRLHESSVAAVNSGSAPISTRIRDRPPSIQGVGYSTPFIQQYKAKCLTYSIHLGLLLVGELKAQAIKLSNEIDELRKEGEASLVSISDQTIKEKATKLLSVKYQSAIRRASRRTIKAHRRKPSQH